MRSALDKIRFNAVTLPLRPFYRRYPFRSPASIRSANDRGMLDRELGFFCNRVPKAANSTVVTTLARLKFGREVGSREAKRMFATPAHLGGTEVDNFDSLFKFTVVRNPYTRVLSAFLDKIERFRERDNHNTTFAEFLQRLRDDHRYLYGNAHWVPQSDLMLIPVERFDLVGRVESLDRDLAQITGRIRPGTSDTITSTTSAGPPPTRASEKLRRYYDDPALIELVRAIYRDDFSAFGYSTDFPA